MVAVLATYENFTGAEVIHEFAGPVMAAAIVSASFGYAYLTRGKAPARASAQQDRANS
jgi:hypothetical protein